MRLYDKIKRYSPVAANVIGGINKIIFGSVFFAEGFGNSETITDELPSIFCGMAAFTSASLISGILATATRDTDDTLRGLCQRALQDIGTAVNVLALYYIIANSSELKEDKIYETLLKSLFFTGGMMSVFGELLNKNKSAVTFLTALSNVGFATFAYQTFGMELGSSIYKRTCVAAGAFRFASVFIGPTVKTATIIRDMCNQMRYEPHVDAQNVV